MTKEKLKKTINYLKNKKVLLLTTSNRWSGDKEEPKSTLLAKHIAEKINNAKIIDVTKLKIYPCEGNVSTRRGNTCGEKKALLKDKEKNPSQCHRCWASINNKDDELWIITKELFESDAVLFLGSVRWGQTNSIYQQLIERLTWIENRASTLKENSIINKIDAGIILTGHNWNGKNVIETQKKVLSFFGFKTPKELSWNWQYTQNLNDETQESYKSDFSSFIKEFEIKIN